MADFETQVKRRKILPDFETQVKRRKIELAKAVDQIGEKLNYTPLEKLHFKETINAKKRNPIKICCTCEDELPRNMGKSFWIEHEEASTGGTGSSETAQKLELAAKEELLAQKAAREKRKKDGHWEWNCWKCAAEKENKDRAKNGERRLTPEEWIDKQTKEHLSNHAERANAYSCAVQALDEMPTKTLSDGREVADHKKMKSQGKIAAAKNLASASGNLRVAFERGKLCASFLMQASRDGAHNLMEIRDHLVTFEAQWNLSPWQGFVEERLLDKLTEYDDVLMFTEVQGVQEPTLQIQWGCTAQLQNKKRCGAVFRANEWREELRSNGRNENKKRAWYCLSCDCRQRPFARGPSIVVDILNTDTDEWYTMLTNPPPSPIMSALTLLKYDTYKKLIEKWGETATQHLPKTKQIKDKKPSPYNGKMYRFEDFDDLDQWSDVDWWIIAGLAVGWSPEETKKYQLDNDDKKMAKMISRRCDELEEIRGEKVAKVIKANVGNLETDGEGDIHMIISNDLKMLTYKCSACKGTYPADTKHWSCTSLKCFKKNRSSEKKHVTIDEKQKCKACSNESYQKKKVRKDKKVEDKKGQGRKRK